VLETTEEDFGSEIVEADYIENHQSIIQQLLTNDRVKDQFAELLLPHVYGS